jgi:uncharacterized protein (UPF0548 family)
MLLSRAPSSEQLKAVLSEQAMLAPTYAEVGATRSAEFPAGYHHDRYEARLGQDRPVFDRGVEGLRRWVAHAGAGVLVTPKAAPIADGGTVILVLPVGPLSATAACRIVYVVDEADRFGFGYGTLPLHPEQGEESFLVEVDADGSVWFRVAAFSRPRDVLARLGSPVSRRLQRRVTNLYLRSMQNWSVRAT